MPRVGKKNFPYNQAGKKEALDYAKKSGMPVEKKAPPKKK